MAAKNAKDRVVFIEPDLSVSQLDYLATIHEVRQADGSAKSSDVAQILGVTRSTVSTTLKSLQAAGLIDLVSYGPVRLTPRGETIAENVCAMREALAKLLTDVLGIDEEVARKTARAFKGTAHPLIPEQLALLQRFMQKNKKKWRKKIDD